MTSEDFNFKYSLYIEEGFTGLQFDVPEVTEFLDKVFQDFARICGFQFCQIKLKFGYARFYSNLSKTLESLVEQEINKIIKADQLHNQIFKGGV
jgi:hypothetical protein